MAPEPGSVLRWFDWMQYVTLPLSEVATSNEFYPDSRMVCSVYLGRRSYSLASG